MMMVNNSKTDTNTHKYIILPDSRLRLVWEVVVLGVVLYYVITIPTRLSISYGCSGSDSSGSGSDGSGSGSGSSDITYCLSRFTSWLIVDYCCDTLMMCDIALRAIVFAHYR